MNAFTIPGCVIIFKVVHAQQNIFCNAISAANASDHITAVVFRSFPIRMHTTFKVSVKQWSVNRDQQLNS